MLHNEKRLNRFNAQWPSPLASSKTSFHCIIIGRRNKMICFASVVANANFDIELPLFRSVLFRWMMALVVDGSLLSGVEFDDALFVEFISVQNEFNGDMKGAN